jgi:hypothetical protein
LRTPHLHVVHTGAGIYPAYYPMDIGGFFLGVKRLGLKADHTFPTNVEVKET